MIKGHRRTGKRRLILDGQWRSLQGCGKLSPYITFLLAYVFQLLRFLGSESNWQVPSCLSALYLLLLLSGTLLWDICYLPFWSQIKSQLTQGKPSPKSSEQNSSSQNSTSTFLKIVVAIIHILKMMLRHSEKKLA
jgi:hypothetical protein